MQELPEKIEQRLRKTIRKEIQAALESMSILPQLWTSRRWNRRRQNQYLWPQRRLPFTVAPAR